MIVVGGGWVWAHQDRSELQLKLKWKLKLDLINIPDIFLSHVTRLAMTIYYLLVDE